MSTYKNICDIKKVSASEIEYETFELFKSGLFAGLLEHAWIFVQTFSVCENPPCRFLLMLLTIRPSDTCIRNHIRMPQQLWHMFIVKVMAQNKLVKMRDKRKSS